MKLAAEMAMKPVCHFLILILITVPLLTGCQNKNMSAPSSAERVQALRVGTPDLLQSAFEIYSFSSSYYGPVFSINLSDSEVTNVVSSTSCSLAANPKWQAVKNFYMNDGLCEYHFSLEPNAVRCMALAQPVARIKNLQTEAVLTLSSSMCSNDYLSICGSEHQTEFNNAISELRIQLESGQACAL